MDIKQIIQREIRYSSEEYSKDNCFESKGFKCFRVSILRDLLDIIDKEKPEEVKQLEELEEVEPYNYEVGYIHYNRKKINELTRAVNKQGKEIKALKGRLAANFSNRGE